MKYAVIVAVIVAFIVGAMVYILRKEDDEDA